MIMMSMTGMIVMSDVVMHFHPGWTVPRALLHLVGMLRFMSDINQPSLITPFYSVLVSISVFLALSTVFYSINPPDHSPLSHSVLPFSFNYRSVYESLPQP